MLFTNILYKNIYPQEVTPAMLDLFLAKGWYRRRDSLFTTNVEFLELGMHKVWWIRYNLEKLDYSDEAKRIWKKNRRFEVITSPLLITEEIKEIYSRYIETIDFTTTEQPEEYLFAAEGEAIFPSEMLELRDESRLVAVGIFDKGDNSIAGIMNFYDPAYKKYSPGKYLILQKIEMAKREWKQFYYPGYVVEGHAKFDYKLFPCNNGIEYYSWMYDTWIPLSKEMFLSGCFFG